MCYVHVNETAVKDSSYMFHIDLGSCVSVILCGRDQSGTVWIGVNHLFKARKENMDMALQHVAELVNSLQEKGATEIACIGVFGAGYREKSLARKVAQKNLITVLEALDLYNLTIEIFQTGFSQGISILKSDSRDSFLIRHQRIDDKEKEIIEIPLSKIFQKK